MPQQKTEDLSRLIETVQASPKYGQIASSLVEQICLQELGKHKDFSTSVKAARTHLHQLVGAYLSPKLNYAQLLQIFRDIPRNDAGAQRDACLSMLRLHNSTAERLPFLPQFFHECLASIAPVRSVLDLACGFNPLATAWMPLAGSFSYHACDVVLPQLAFLNDYFQLAGINGTAFECDLTQGTPPVKVQLALLLKTLPLLDQIDKDLSARVLNEIQAEHILVSYPAKSLSGKSKGMASNYTRQFEQLISTMPFQVQAFSFPTEIAFLLTRET